MAKEKYYNIQGLLETKADYMMLLGERSNGKSYQAKYVCLWEAYTQCDYLTYLLTKEKVPKERYMFGYIRRFGEDIKTTPVNDYFGDMSKVIEEISSGEYDRIDTFQGKIYFAKYDYDKDKIVRGKEIGRPFSLNSAQHYKSRMFPLIGNLLMEEVIPDDGQYINNEPKMLFSIVSTIARRDKIRVLMIGNTMNRVCPYFWEWSLTHVIKQKQGTIDIYNQPTDDFDEQGNPIYIQIAVEMCESTGQRNKMFFGQKAKSIVTGVWDSDIHPHLEGTLSDYDEHYQLLLINGDFCFMIKLLTGNDNKFLYVYPYTGERDKVDRRISEEYNLSPFITPNLTKVTKYDEIVINLLKDRKICFSDNLTGTDFWNTIKERGKI